MISDFIGPIPYDAYSIGARIPANQIGVYYCGVAMGGQSPVYYVGRSVAEQGVRGRLLAHRNERKWGDVTHVWYKACSTEAEAIALESADIKRFQPKYNEVGKQLTWSR